MGVAASLPLAAYGLESAAVTPLPGGSINEAYKVESSAGVFVLKQFSSPAMTPARLQQLVDVQRRLRRDGLPVPEVISATDGADFAVLGGVYYVLSKFVSGRTYSAGEMPRDAALDMGHVHAKLLDSMSRLPGAEPTTLPGPATIQARLTRLLDLGVEQRRSSSLHEQACLILEQRLRMLEAWRGRTPEVSTQWTHGDYTWRNVLFDTRDKVVAVIDFDNLRSMHPARDVMRCFTLSFPYGSRTALDYFEGYARASALTPDEARSFVHIYHYLSTYGTWPADVLLEQPEQYQSRWDVFMNPQPSSWETGWDELAKQLAAIAGAANPGYR